MVEQQLSANHEADTDQVICADCVLHLDHHDIQPDCLLAIRELAEEWWDNPLLTEVMTFVDYYETVYEQDLLLSQLGETGREVSCTDIRKSG